ncbi:MAG TPA: pyridoxal 5'-phosphate synthase glutaminase subunit PdxT [Candidatus Nanopelagicales bacterium]|nr:pyridoxal 5'-phosphate synthase glutaminase subunit PdxT [Candidatus Nanopelagicales bacterium]
MRPVVGVLALQGDVREHERVLADLGASAVRVRDRADLAGIHALVIPGGESTTMSNLAVRWGLLEPLRERLRAGLPAYGSCAGMIMLADRIEDGRQDQQTIGGLDVVVRRNAFGRQVDSFETDLTMPAIGAEPFHAVFIRAPWVESAGPDVQVLGSVAEGPAAGRIVAVRQGRLLATSFHPELTGDTRVHAYFLEMVRELA